MNNKKQLADLKNNLLIIFDDLAKVNDNLDFVASNYQKGVNTPYTSNSKLNGIKQDLNKIRSNINDIYIPEIEKEINS